MADDSKVQGFLALDLFFPVSCHLAKATLIIVSGFLIVGFPKLGVFINIKFSFERLEVCQEIFWEIGLEELFLLLVFVIDIVSSEVCTDSVVLLIFGGLFGGYSPSEMWPFFKELNFEGTLAGVDFLGDVEQHGERGDSPSDDGNSLGSNHGITER